MNIRTFFLYLIIATSSLIFTQNQAVGAVSSDLQNQLGNFEAALRNASGDLEQIKTLVQAKLLEFPDEAVFIAAFAVSSVPDFTADITRLVAFTAPLKADEIAYAVAYANPNLANDVKAICAIANSELTDEISLAVDVALEKRKADNLQNPTPSDMAAASLAGTESFSEQLANQNQIPGKTYGN